jgi:hypothetical protein
MGCYNTDYIVQISIFRLVIIINYSQVLIILLICREVCIYIYIYIERERERARGITLFHRNNTTKQSRYILTSSDVSIRYVRFFYLN